MEIWFGSNLQRFAVNREDVERFETIRKAFAFIPENETATKPFPCTVSSQDGFERLLFALRSSTTPGLTADVLAAEQFRVRNWDQMEAVLQAYYFFHPRDDAPDLQNMTLVFQAIIIACQTVLLHPMARKQNESVLVEIERYSHHPFSPPCAPSSADDPDELTLFATSCTALSKLTRTHFLST